ncbi:uncharacterized protein PSFLO_05859 [Pseudozyma flocculosa]|uniref:Uncharacterized protein n=1 Tax=Pseudozyma flocculosa TaxID=84751 RepID=A0A5C3F9G3_9BASI|nr:uncharacterized protein PSFLO_05859 [Pseudozyma flocculosa]
MAAEPLLLAAKTRRAAKRGLPALSRSTRPYMMTARPGQAKRRPRQARPPHDKQASEETTTGAMADVLRPPPGSLRGTLGTCSHALRRQPARVRAGPLSQDDGRMYLQPGSMVSGRLSGVGALRAQCSPYVQLRPSDSELDVRSRSTS